MSKRRGRVTAKRSEAGFTLVELLVVIAIIALLMAILMPALSKAREMGKRAVCMSQIKQLGLAWQQYCDDNKEKVPIGDVWYSWNFPNPAPVAVKHPLPSPQGPQLAWSEWPHKLHPGTPPSYANNYTNAYTPEQAPGLSDEIWNHAMSEGTMGKYIKDYKVYKCPVGDKGYRTTYYLSHSMVTYPGSAGNDAPMIALRTQIRRTFERFVFLDVGSFKRGAFYLNYSSPGGTAPPGSFGDHRPVRHGNGTVFVFADQHVEYHKWRFATNTVETGGWGGTPQPCDCDWRWFCKVTWGNVPLNCTTSGTKCDY
jgi:prepilin-type N-terminal cleavage/methylation domain-containing protein